MFRFIICLLLPTLAFAQDSWQFDLHLAPGYGDIKNTPVGTDETLFLGAGLDLVKNNGMWSLDFTSARSEFKHRGTSQLTYELDYDALHLGYTHGYKWFLMGASVGQVIHLERLSSFNTGIFERDKRETKAAELGLSLGLQLTHRMAIRVHHNRSLDEPETRPFLGEADKFNQTYVALRWRFRKAPAKALFSGKN